MSKNIKNIIACVTLVMLVFSLSACDYGYYLYFDHLHRDSEVIRIELIKYIDPIVNEDPLVKNSFDMGKLEVIEILEDDYITDFMIRLSKIGSLGSKYRNEVNSHNGTGIRIIHSDNTFTIITIMEMPVVNTNGSDGVFTADYDANTNLVYSLGFSWQELIDDLKVLINEYFTAQIS